MKKITKIFMSIICVLFFSLILFSAIAQGQLPAPLPSSFNNGGYGNYHSYPNFGYPNYGYTFGNYGFGQPYLSQPYYGAFSSNYDLTQPYNNYGGYYQPQSYGYGWPSSYNYQLTQPFTYAGWYNPQQQPYQNYYQGQNYTGSYFGSPYYPNMPGYAYGYSSNGTIFSPEPLGMQLYDQWRLGLWDYEETITQDDDGETFSLKEGDIIEITLACDYFWYEVPPPQVLKIGQHWVPDEHLSDDDWIASEDLLDDDVLRLYFISDEEPIYGQINKQSFVYKARGEGETELVLYYLEVDDPDEDVKDTFRITIRVED